MVTRGRRRAVLAAAVVLVALVAIAIAVFVVGDTPEEVSIDDAVAGLEREGSDDGDEAPTPVDDEDATDGEVTGDETADGVWTVATDVEPFDLATSTGSFVGYRIDEELANIGATQAVGRTPAVSGSLEVDGTSVTDAVVEGELAQLASDRTQRDGRVAGALRADEHPVVRFVAEPFDLPEPLLDGDRVDVDVPGTLEAAGGSTEVVAAMTAERVGDVVVVTGQVEVALADLGIEAPSATVVLGVADIATIEWQLYLTRE